MGVYLNAGTADERIGWVAHDLIGKRDAGSYLDGISIVVTNAVRDELNPPIANYAYAQAFLAKQLSIRGMVSDCEPEANGKWTST